MTNDIEHQIIWQKWQDPFGEDDIFNENFDPDLGEYIGDDQDSENIPSLDHQINKKVKVIATPMGIIPITENTASNKIFNFWLGHTNFDITKDIALLIEETTGVETLDIFTRYRFRISVGKAFDDSSVMRNINKKVYREIYHG
jgi:hypothetical protein